MKGLDKQNKFKCQNCGLTFQDFSLRDGYCPVCDQIRQGLLLNKQIEETINNTIYVDGHEFYDLKETIPAIKSLISQAVQEALSTYKDQLVREIEEHFKKVEEDSIKQIESSFTSWGAGKAVDVTSKMIQIGQVTSGIKKVKEDVISIIRESKE